MKYRIISTVFLFIVLGICYVVFESNHSIPPPNNDGITINQ